jgi:hypothetical protein
MDWLDKLLDTATKLAPLPSFVLAFGSGICLFARDSFVARLGLLDFRNAQRHWFGVAFLVSSLYLVGHSGIWSAKRVNKWRKGKKLDQLRKELLLKLNSNERAFLRRFVVTDGEHQYARLQDGVANGLDAKGIIYKAAMVFNMREGMPYNMQPWAWDLILKDEAMLGTKDEYETTMAEMREERSSSYGY